MNRIYYGFLVLVIITLFSALFGIKNHKKESFTDDTSTDITISLTSVSSESALKDGDLYLTNSTDFYKVDSIEIPKEILNLNETEKSAKNPRITSDIELSNDDNNSTITIGSGSGWSLFKKAPTGAATQQLSDDPDNFHYLLLINEYLSSST